MCECVFVSKWWSVYGMTFDHDTSTHQCILDWVRLIVPSQFPSNNVGCELSHTNTQQPSLCLIPNKKATQPDASKNLRSPAHSTAQHIRTLKSTEVKAIWMNDFTLKACAIKIEILNMDGGSGCWYVFQCGVLSIFFNGNQWPCLYEANRLLSKRKSVQIQIYMDNSS